MNKQSNRGRPKSQNKKVQKLFWLTPELVQQIEIHCATVGMTQSDFIERAARNSLGEEATP
jgi:hypothetical protein